MALVDIARADGKSVAALVGEIDKSGARERNAQASLSAAIRALCAGADAQAGGSGS